MKTINKKYSYGASAIIFSVIAIIIYFTPTIKSFGMFFQVLTIILPLASFLLLLISIILACISFLKEPNKKYHAVLALMISVTAFLVFCYIISTDLERYQETIIN